MEFIVIGLALCLIITNIAWLVFLNKLLQRNQHERWELNERIKSPEIFVPPPATFEAAAVEPPKAADEKPVDEFDLVGQVDPHTPLRED
jgi:hypothetical protein